MLICLPGIASSVKRAPTSATRSEPFAITMNCTIVMIRKTTHADHEIAADHELAEGVDDVARRPHAAGSSLRRRDVQRQAEQRREQQQRRERGTATALGT